MIEEGGWSKWEIKNVNVLVSVDLVPAKLFLLKACPGRKGGRASFL